MRTTSKVIAAALGFTCCLGLPSQIRAQNSFPRDTDDRRQSSQPPAPRPRSAPVQQPARDPALMPANEPSTFPGGPQAEPGLDPRFAQVKQAEEQDFGVEPSSRLHPGPMHAPTPTRIPGGSVISTAALNALYEKNDGKLLVFDVLGGPEGLPDAQNALPAGQGGSFSDQTQREFGNYLQQVTGGNKQAVLVFYCKSVECWMSYNAALRAIQMGYSQVFWYRGGIDAWQQAGLKTQKRGY